MKRVLVLLALGVLLFAASCDTGTNSGTENPPTNPPTNPPITIDRSIEVSDSSGNVIGYLVSTYADATGLVIMTESGYICSLRWDGSLVKTYDLMFSEADLAGDCYYYDEDYEGGTIHPYYKNGLFSDGTRFYQPDVQDGQNYASLITDPITWLSSAQEGNGTYTLNANYGAYFKMKRCTAQEILALEDLTGPLQLSPAGEEESSSAQETE